VALPILVYTETGSALLTSTVVALESAPYLVFGLLAGALADRMPRRSSMVAADVISAVVLGTVPDPVLILAVDAGSYLISAGVILTQLAASEAPLATAVTSAGAE